MEEFDKSIDEFSKINETKLNYSNNELENIDINKNKLIELSQNMKGEKLNQIQELKVQIKDIKTNCDEQLKIIKDREDYITKQTDIVSNNLKSVANQNEKAVEALRQENQQLKNQNYTLSKRLS